MLFYHLCVLFLLSSHGARILDQSITSKCDVFLHKIQTFPKSASFASFNLYKTLMLNISNRGDSNRISLTKINPS